MTSEKRSTAFQTFITIILYASLIVLGYKYYFATPKEVVVPEDVSGEKFIVPKSILERTPLVTNIPSFFFKADEKKLLIGSNVATYSFSESSAAIKDIKFKTNKDGFFEQPSSFPASEGLSASLACLFLANTEDRLDFKLIKKDVNEQFITLLFEATYKGWLVAKSFKIPTNRLGVELTLQVLPARSSASEAIESPLLVFPLPCNEMIDANSVNGFVNDKESFKINKVSDKDLPVAAWKIPYAFGGGDKFFAHVFLNDKPSTVVKRSYFISSAKNHVNAVLELWPIEKEFSHTFNFYFGPKQLHALESFDPQMNDVLGLGFFELIFKFLLNLLENLFGFLNNYGLALMALAVIIRLLFLPLTFLSRRNLVAVQRFEALHSSSIAEINRKYQNDLLTRTQKLNEFHKANNSPQSASQILYLLPTLILLFLVIGLYRTLGSYVSLFKAPFFGWIVDLSSRDPFYVLPILLALIQTWQIQRGPKTALTSNPALKYISGAALFWLASSMASGAVLYWLTDRIFAFVEELIIDKVVLRKDF